jgi:hypothetical protein
MLDRREDAFSGGHGLLRSCSVPIQSRLVDLGQLVFEESMQGHSARITVRASPLLTASRRRGIVRAWR